MKRGSYKIQDGYSGSGGGREATEHVWCETPARPPDSSFSACLLALILFLFLCVVIMLATWPWKAAMTTTDAETDSPIEAGLSGGGMMTTLPSKLPNITEESPTETDSPIEAGLSGGGIMTTLPSKLPDITEESPTVTDSIHSTFPPTSESDESITMSSVEIISEEGINVSDEVGRTAKSATHEGLVDGTEGHTATSEEEDTDAEGVVVDGWTLECMAIASQILSFINHSEKPCHNIYEFACGGMRGEGGEWIAEDPKEHKPMQRIKDNLPMHYTSTSSTIKKFMGFYEKCILYEEVSMEIRLQQAKGIIDNVGTFLLSESDNASISDLLVNLLFHNFPTIFDIQLEPLYNDKFVLKLSLPELKSPLGHSSEDDVLLNGWHNEACVKRATDRPRDGRKEDNLNTRYNEYTQCKKNTSTYLTEVEIALRNLKLFEKEDEATATSFIKKTVDFLGKELLNVIQGNLPSQTERNINMTERPFKLKSLSNLEEECSVVNWAELINKLFGDSIPDNVKVNFYDESYFMYICPGLEKLSNRELHNGLLAMFAHDIYYGLVVNRNSCFREKYCLDVAANLMPEVASSLFLSSFREDELDEFKSQISNLFTKLKSQMISEVEAIVWLDKNSKDKMLNKIAGMELIDDGGRLLFLDDKYLEKQFNEYPLNSTYLEDAASLMQRLRKKMYGAYEKKPWDEIWSFFVSSYSTKAKAFYEMNTIVVPYGVMLHPFMMSNCSKFLQMATVGSEIAKVMWHHFDLTGMWFSDVGEKSDHYSLGADVISSMEAVGNCMMNQFQTEKFVQDEGITVKYELPVSLSINSRLAEIGGIHLAFNALIKNEPVVSLPWLHLRKGELYFLAIAQSMCTKASVNHYAVSMFEDEDLPPFLRAEDMARNSIEFIKAFSCEAQKDTEPPCVPFTLAEKTEYNGTGISH